jgi:hypothetical protein
VMVWSAGPQALKRTSFLSASMARLKVVLFPVVVAAL